MLGMNIENDVAILSSRDPLVTVKSFYLFIRFSRKLRILCMI